MAVLLLTSASGSPGVTATAIGLSLVWPSTVLLADCDRTPAQSVLAGYLRGTDAGSLGLAGLARAHREGRPLEHALVAETIPLALGDVRRSYLPGFSSAGAAQLFEPAWTGLGDAFDAASRAGVDVIIDAGRIGANGPPPGLLRHADAVLLVVRTHLPALSGLRLHLPVLGDSLERLRGSVSGLGVLLVGEGRPYTAAEISGQFGVPVAGAVPYDPAGAAVLAEGTEEPRRYGDSRYIRGLRAFSSSLLARLHTQRQLIAGTA